MSLKYDLHSHSTVSDGTLTPAQLVHLAADAGVNVLALTDHDNVSGIGQARMAAKEKDISIVPSVEISVSWNGHTVHILGLNIDPDAPILRAGLERLCDYRQWRAREIGRRLAKKGIEGAYEGACEEATGALVGRLHFARFLVQRGHARDVKEVFRKFLVSGKPGYVSGEWASLEEALGWIGDAGGMAVIA
ncbi:PHP domain-containing protein, partial [Thiolapillus sp.]|uniref:PHP domain-containing protein n=1 Tax=Thiolapillus sp. TaxID=2017437 RepID=UPI003AF71900